MAGTQSSCAEDTYKKLPRQPYQTAAMYRYSSKHILHHVWVWFFELVVGMCPSLRDPMVTCIDCNLLFDYRGSLRF